MTLAYDHNQTWYRPIATSRTGWWPSALIVTIVFVSFRPFTTSDIKLPGQQAVSGDIVNQIGFGVLGVICLFLLAKKTCSNALSALLNPLWIAFLPVLALSVLSADYLEGALRAMIFSLIVVLAAAATLSQPRNLSDLVSIFTVAAGFTILLCYIAVFAFPEQGIHESSGFEAMHGGLWRGIYDHKNIASYVLGCFAIMGWFIARNGKPFAGAMIATAALMFVVQAGSKTVLGILPVAIVTAVLADWITWRGLKVLVICAPVLGLFTVTLGAVLYPPILIELQSYVPGLTYTGRTDLWIFGLENLRLSPWIGYGFESFWNTPRVGNMVQPIELNWDVRGSVHGHNSWLDGALAFGLPGMALLIAIIVLMPLRDYLNIPKAGNAGKLAHLYLTIWVFTAMGASLESFFFRRADPVWFCMLLAIIGLRLTSHLSRHHNHAPLAR